MSVEHKAFDCGEDAVSKYNWRSWSEIWEKTDMASNTSRQAGCVDEWIKQTSLTMYFWIIVSLYMQKDGGDFLPTWLNNQEQSEDNFGNGDWSWSEETSVI